MSIVPLQGSGSFMGRSGSGKRSDTPTVMPGPVPGIHALHSQQRRGCRTSPAMTVGKPRRPHVQTLPPLLQVDPCRRGAVWIPERQVQRTRTSSASTGCG